MCQAFRSKREATNPGSSRGLGPFRYRSMAGLFAQGSQCRARDRRGWQLTTGSSATEHPEVREKISAMMAAHWEHWVDQPIPILGNRTPMEPGKNPDGREIVQSIVIQAERDRRSPHLQTDEDVFRRPRERLRLSGRCKQTCRRGR